jgi:hypothetical protein
MILYTFCACLRVERVSFGHSEINQHKSPHCTFRLPSRAPAAPSGVILIIASRLAYRRPTLSVSPRGAPSLPATCRPPPPPECSSITARPTHTYHRSMQPELPTQVSEDICTKKTRNTFNSSVFWDIKRRKVI